MAKNNLVFELSKIGAKVRALRISKGYTTSTEFAKAYNLPTIQYWRVEHGKANITIKSLLKIISIHNLTLEIFFSGRFQSSKH